MHLLDSMAIGSGMGYYSLSSVLISHSKGAELGSISLMSNILRELITLFFAPILVRTFGKLAPISAGGVTSMDIIRGVCGGVIAVIYLVLSKTFCILRAGVFFLL
ncbi:MAG: lysine exporter LysO family protein [Bacteroidales bacterium]|nr:lysine exporter LysO family protein [Bacteroidales bacterium]